MKQNRKRSLIVSNLRGNLTSLPSGTDFLQIAVKFLSEAGAYAAAAAVAHNTHRYLLSLSLCESARRDQ